MKPFELVNASSLDSALAELAKGGGATLKAGGVDLLDLMKECLAAPKRLVNLRTASGLDGLAGDAEKGVSLGPLLTLAQIAEHGALQKSVAYRALSQAAAAAATPQIRNMATLGGNLCQRPRCWYFRSHAHHCLRKGGKSCFALAGENAYHALFENDACAIVHPSALAVALLALDAKLELRSARGKRELALGEFFVTPGDGKGEDVRRENVLATGEIISAVRLAPAGARRSVYLKQKHKQSFDWPLAEVAVCVALDSAGKVKLARVVLGAAAPRPLRVGAAEKLLAGKAIDEAAARAAAKAAVAKANPLGHNAYKVALFETLVRRALLQAVKGA